MSEGLLSSHGSQCQQGCGLASKRRNWETELGHLLWFNCYFLRFWVVLSSDRCCDVFILTLHCFFALGLFWFNIYLLYCTILWHLYDIFNTIQSIFLKKRSKQDNAEERPKKRKDDIEDYNPSISWCVSKGCCCSTRNSSLEFLLKIVFLAQKRKCFYLK